MPRKDSSGDSIISETGNWNVADNYSKIKIMKPLLLSDIYEDVATFGYESLVEELINHEAPSDDFIRYKGLERLIRELIKLINNAKFALKKPGTKSQILGYKDKLLKFQKIIPKLIKKNSNQLLKTTTIKIINENLFTEILSHIVELKSKINEPLNKNHLIFTDKQEFDPIAFKKNLKHRMINQG